MSTVGTTDLRYLVAGIARFEIVGETELMNKSATASGETWVNTPTRGLVRWGKEKDENFVSI